MRIRLTGRVPLYMDVCLKDTNPELRELARREVGHVDTDRLWAALEENNRYAHIANFSSRTLGNEDVVYALLIGAPSLVSQRLLEAYERQGYLERGDVNNAYSADHLAQSVFYPLARAAFRVPMRLRRKMW